MMYEDTSSGARVETYVCIKDSYEDIHITYYYWNKIATNIGIKVTEVLYYDDVCLDIM